MACNIAAVVPLSVQELELRRYLYSFERGAFCSQSETERSPQMML